MDDTAKGLHISYLINSASIQKGDKRLAAQYLDLEASGGMRTTRERTVVLDIKGGKLRKLGKVIGTIDGDTVTITGTTYTIELGPAPQQRDMPTYRLVVKKGDTTIIETDGASSLCAGLKKSMTDAESREEVRRRVIFYLAWRETGN